jgi:hypothetical protein
VLGTSLSDDNNGVLEHQAVSTPCLATDFPLMTASAGRDATVVAQSTTAFSLTLLNKEEMR